MKKILSIDGGGVRGLIPALILSEIEIRCGRPLHSLFDLMAGTSTGGVLVLGLVKPLEDGSPKFSARQLLRFYEHDGKQIFHQSWLQKLLNPGTLMKSKYDRQAVETVLEDYFGDSRLSDCLTDVLITSYETERRSAWFFTSKEVHPEKDFLIRDVAFATSAAPTYFRPYLLQTKSREDYFSFVDGAVFANNPAMCAYTEIRNKFPDEDEILLLSIGTGEISRPIPYRKAEKWGVAGWARPMFDIIIDGINDTVDHQIRQIMDPDDRKSYYRIQANLWEDTSAIDCCDDANIRRLKLIAEACIRDNSERIDTICQLLTDGAGPDV